MVWPAGADASGRAISHAVISPVEAVRHREVGRSGRDPQESLTIERVRRGGEVEVVLVPVAGDVDVGLGSGGGCVNPAGGHRPGRVLDGVGREGDRVVDAALGSSSGGSVQVEKAAGGSMRPMPPKSTMRLSRARWSRSRFTATIVPSAPLRT